jgi:uncharacterized protein (TIGR02284 family)
MEAQSHLVDRIDELTPHERRNVVASLHELLATSHDARAGYLEAARDVRDADLAGLFESCAAEHAEAANALAKLLLSLGADPRVPHTLGGELHRKVIALRSTLSHGDPAAVLPECERGEHVAIARFERALGLKMPLRVADTLLDLVTACRERHAAFDRMRHPW